MNEGQGLPPIPTEQTSDLQAGNWCLTISFSQDLVPKFCEAPLEQRQPCWLVLGSYDYANIVQIVEKGLDEAMVLDPHRPWIDTKNSILYPLAGADLTPEYWRPISEQDTTDRDSTDCPMLVYVGLKLSPIVFSLPDSPRGSPLRAIRNLSLLIQTLAHETISTPPFGVFGSLGGDDLVILFRPSWPKELQAINQLLVRLRDVRARDIEALHKPQGNGKDLLPHACFSIVPTLLYRQSAHKHFTSADFTKQEKETGIHFDSRLWVECGHEAYVHRSTSKGRSKSTRLSWGHYSLRARFNNLSTLSQMASDFLLRHGWRHANIISTSTTISFPVSFQKATSPSAHVRIADKLSSYLKEIDDAILTFSKSYLNNSESTELLTAFNDFRLCFYRHDLFPIGLELLPFFLQFSKMLQENGHWNDFFLGADSSSVVRARRIEGMHVELRQLLRDLGRTLRNRKEQLSSAVSPPVPPTLRVGASKLLTAYFALAWTCTELLLSGANAFDDMAHCGVCVIGGFSGRVYTQEMFAEFRRFVEKSDRTLLRFRNNWNSRLLVVDISGQSLLRPEQAVLHCLHEIAENSEWIRLSTCAKLRVHINSWLYKSAVEIFRSVLAGKAAQGAGNMPLPTLNFCSHYIFAGISRYLLRNSGDGNVDHALGHNSPIEFMCLLQAALCDMCADRTTLHHFRDSFIPQLQEPASSREALLAEIGEAVTYMELRDLQEICEKLDVVSALCVEVLSDTAMWISLERILACERAPVHEKLNHVNKYYGSILRLASESSPNVKLPIHVAEQVFIRWAIQICAFEKATQWGDYILEQLQDFRDVAFVQDPAITLDLMRKAPWISRSCVGNIDGSLSSSLRQFKTYGGDIDTPSVSDLSADNRIIKCFRRAWDNPSIANRINLVNQLWSIGKRNAFPVPFKLNPTEIHA